MAKRAWVQAVVVNPRSPRLGQILDIDWASRRDPEIDPYCYFETLMLDCPDLGYSVQFCIGEVVLIDDRNCFLIPTPVELEIRDLPGEAKRALKAQGCRKMRSDAGKPPQEPKKTPGKKRSPKGPRTRRRRFDEI